ncbi:hypothetical protein [Azospirillum sp. B506]|uniref:hypothetical protein n=1 Tax=Azospirillum sp. B506 TaxID=137721 RepID=UPI00034C51D1|nr:hypothetical protein [Azospirillum sp. B506]
MLQVRNASVRFSDRDGRVVHALDSDAVERHRRLPNPRRLLMPFAALLAALIILAQDRCQGI